MTWCDALETMRTVQGVVAIIFGVGLSYLIEYWPKFEELDAKIKRLVIVGICLTVPLVALGLAWATGCVANPTGEDVWQAVMVGGVVFLGSQFAHTREL